MPKIEYLDVDSIRFDKATQPRAAISEPTVEEYAAELAESDPRAAPIFREVVVYFDGSVYWLADGYHRVLAHRKAGRAKVNAHVFKGTKRDAILHAVGANSDHGLRRSDADKLKAVMTLLADPEWAKWSDSEIARRCKVSQGYVSKIHRDLSPSLNSELSDRLRKTVNKHGQEATMNTANIGRKPESNGHAKPTKTIVEDRSPDYTDEDFDQSEPDELPTEAPAEPKGRSRVNGVVQDDPPEIAEKRAAGKIPADYVPDVDTSDDPTDAETVAPPREPGEDESESDEEWAAMLPLASRLRGACRNAFLADAILYRELEEQRKLYAHHARRAINRARRRNANGEYAYRVDWFLSLNDPARWVACPKTEHGGCGATGQVPMIGQCPKCRGRGYLIVIHREDAPHVAAG